MYILRYQGRLRVVVTIEAFDVAILLRLARRDVVPPDL